MRPPQKKWAGHLAAERMRNRDEKGPQRCLDSAAVAAVHRCKRLTLGLAQGQPCAAKARLLDGSAPSDAPPSMLRRRGGPPRRRAGADAVAKRRWRGGRAPSRATQRAPRRRLARRTRKTSARGLPGAAVRALAGDVMTPETNAPPRKRQSASSTCTRPKCAGTFVWRFFRDKFCAEAETCKRGTPRPPPL